MVQAKRCGNLAGAPIHENNKEGGKYHGQRIEFGHPGNKHGGEALASRDGRRDGVVDASHKKQTHQAAQCAGQHHRTDDDLFYFDAHVFRGIFTLAHNRDGIALFAVIQVNIHKYGDDDSHKNAQQIFGTEQLGQPARVGILVDDADLTGALGHLPQDGEKSHQLGCNVIHHQGRQRLVGVPFCLEKRRDKAPGDTVSAATLNQSGHLICEATRVGEDTTLSQIIQMVSDAAATKAPIAKVADRVSGVFVPTVITIAIITTIVWLLAGQTIGFALARGISVLVISCPCALGLATPVAIMVGNGMGAKHGTMFKTAVSLEETGKIQIVALDKTGTITSGEPRVTDILPAGGYTEETLLAKACALEKKSEHPLSRAVLALAQERGIDGGDTEQFTAVPGNGLTGVLNGHTLAGGNLSFIEKNAAVPEDLKAQASALAEKGKTPLFFSEEGQLIGIIAVADVIKEDSPRAVKELQNMGIHVVMLTGDNERTAKAIGAEAGVDEVIAGVLPDGKEAVISRLKKKGKVAMVGDGINDAPALTSADIGIAIGAGTDIAIDAADIVLMKSRLSDVPAAIRLSRATLRNIHENLFWAFIYNIIGIPLAAGVWIPLFHLTLNPMFGAAAMSLSSFCVVTNALRLNFFKMHDASHDKPHKNALGNAPLLSSTTDVSADTGAVAANTKTSQTATDNSNDTVITLKIKGMMCGHCEAHVKSALEALDGVTEATASHEAGTAVVHLSGEVSDQTLKATIKEAGYDLKKVLR